VTNVVKRKVAIGAGLALLGYLAWRARGPANANAPETVDIKFRTDPNTGKCYRDVFWSDGRIVTDEMLSSICNGTL